MVLLEDIDLEDEDVIRADIRNHFKYTGSTTALRILQNWDEEKVNFIKIMPEEYKRALQAAKQELATA